MIPGYACDHDDLTLCSGAGGDVKRWSVFRAVGGCFIIGGGGGGSEKP